jgi:hypothetical protein
MRDENGGGLRRKPQTWLRDGQIAHRMVDFFAPASVMWTLLSQIGHRHENLVTGGANNGHKSDVEVAVVAGAPASGTKPPIMSTSPVFGPVMSSRWGAAALGVAWWDAP